MTATDAVRRINRHTDALAADPLAITRAYDELCELSKLDEAGVLARLFDLALAAPWAELVTNCSNDDSKRALTCYLNLISSLVVAAEHRSLHTQTTAPSAAVKPKGKKRAKQQQADDTDGWDWEQLKVRALTAFGKIAQLPLSKYMTDAERDTCITTITRALNELLHNKDRVTLKAPQLKRLLFTVYADCITVQHHDARPAIEQNLKFFDFLAEPMAELAHFLASERDHPSLALGLLQGIGQTEYIDGDAVQIKSMAAFVTHLANLNPKLVLKSLVHLQLQLECNEYAMRIAILHAVGAAATYLLSLDDESSDEITATGTAEHQVPQLLEVIEERYRDVVSHVRKKCVTLTADLVAGNKYLYAKCPDQWLTLLELAVSRISDKNQPVRAAAIKCVTQFLVSHPFSLHGDTLEHEAIRAKFAEVKQELNAFLTQAEKSMEQEDAVQLDEHRLTVLNAKHKYFSDLCKFLDQMHTHAVPHLAQLLASKNKTEVIDTMDFFVRAHELKLQPGASVGLTKMWHLVYNVRNPEHIADIQRHLVQCFREVYLHGDIVKNLITLTYRANLADRTCLAKIVTLSDIPQQVRQHLWAILASSAAIPKKQRRGAALVLSWMEGNPQQPSEFGGEQLAILLRVLRRANDDWTLAAHACRLLTEASVRLPIDQEVFSVLTQHLSAMESDTDEAGNLSAWYTFAQAAISCIFRVAQQPLKVAHEAILRLAAPVLNAVGTSSIDAERLCRLFYVLGHTAIQTLVYLEDVEADYKRRKQAAGTDTTKIEPARKKQRRISRRMSRASRRSSAGGPGGNHTDPDDDGELDQVVGTMDDVFTENVAALRELRLVTGTSSLLGTLAPLVVCAVQDPRMPERVRAHAAVCLVAYMCISGTFCEAHLPVLIHAMRTINEPTWRSNLVIAFGDLVVSWNNIVDDDINVLYDALRADLTVKKNALMVLLHLILNGMVKVKGQLSALAMCIEDEDERIAGLTRLFLSELASKEGALYNNLSDVISHLLLMSDQHAEKKDVEAPVLSKTILSEEEEQPDENEVVPTPQLQTPEASSSGAPQVDESAMHRVLKFLFGFINKDKQVENLIDKLCARLRDTESPRHWRAILYALSQLSYETNTESKCAKLLDHYTVWADKLAKERDCAKYMSEIAQRAHKAQPDSQGAVREFVRVVEDAKVGVLGGIPKKTSGDENAPETAKRGGGTGARRGGKRAGNAKTAPRTPRKPASSKTRSATTRGATRRGVRVDSDDDPDDDDFVQ